MDVDLTTKELVFMQAWNLADGGQFKLTNYKLSCTSSLYVMAVW